MRFMQIESVLQTKNRSEPAKHRFSVALHATHDNHQYFSYNLILYAVLVKIVLVNFNLDKAFCPL